MKNNPPYILPPAKGFDLTKLVSFEQHTEEDRIIEEILGSSPSQTSYMDTAIDNMEVYYKFNGNPELEEDSSDYNKTLLYNDQYVNELRYLIENCIKYNELNEININADVLAQLIFPTPQNMVFISHLHSEKDKADKIKERIKENSDSVQGFIDSDVWGNVYDTLYDFQKTFASTDKPNSFDLYKCNQLAKHLYLMLSIALTKAIQESPLFVFIPPEANKGGESDFISSPWVIHELMIASLLPDRDLLPLSQQRLVKEAYDIHIWYPLRPYLQKLHKCTLGELTELINQKLPH